MVFTPDSGSRFLGKVCTYLCYCQFVLYLSLLLPVCTVPILATASLYCTYPCYCQFVLYLSLLLPVCTVPIHATASLYCTYPCSCQFVLYLSLLLPVCTVPIHDTTVHPQMIIINELTCLQHSVSPHTGDMLDVEHVNKKHIHTINRIHRK